MKKINLAIVLLLTVTLATAQTKTKTYRTTDEMINKISDIVKPLKEQADILLKEDATGTFKAYQKDVSALNKMKAGSEKSKAVQQISEKYEAFFKDIWNNLKVDEKYYRLQILSVFPANIREKITFQEFLNFSVNSSSKTITKPIPPPNPSPKNLCINVCDIAAGDVTGTGGLIASGGGSYGNCFLRASGWAVVAGKNELFADLKNNITIPGTFPDDSRKLRVKLSFELNQEATAITLFGCSIASTSVSTYQGYEYIEAIAPFIFIASKTVKKSYSEEFVIEKSEINQSIIKAYAESVAVLINGNWSFSECNNIKWSICEE